MKILLKLKHWQMFLILFLPFVFTSDSTAGQVIQILWFMVFLFWIYSIGTVLQEKLPEGLKISTGYFKFSILFLVVYLTVISIFFDGGYSINQDNYTEYGQTLWIIIPLHLYLMWSILYSFYFAAKTLMSVVEQKIVGFDKCFGYFFGFWFFPIGIWFIQPKIQKLYA